MTTAENEGTRPAPTGEKARVLFADDSKLVRVSARKILAPRFDVVLAEDGEQAWEVLRNDSTIQVLFTDLGMPELDGYGLIQRIRESDDERIRNQPVVVITGAAEDEDVRRRVFELGATDFITKPFKATEVLARAEAHASYRRDKASLEENTHIDVLTGALNRTGWEAQLVRDVSFACRHRESLAVILFELDHFNGLHRRLGKQVAAGLVKRVAKALLGAVRKEDSVGRFGAAKFIVILPMAKAESVVVLAKRLCARVRELEVRAAGEPLPISMSAGVSVLRKGESVGARSLVNTAEKALRNAVQVGAGNVQILKPESDRAPDKAASECSIDSLLEAIEQRQTDVAESQLDDVIERLAPLVALMSREQKRRLLG